MNIIQQLPSSAILIWQSSPFFSDRQLTISIARARVNIALLIICFPKNFLFFQTASTWTFPSSNPTVNRKWLINDSAF